MPRKDLLDMEVPMESSVVSASTARSTINDYFNSSNSFNIIEGINPITGRPITTSIFNLNQNIQRERIELHRRLVARNNALEEI